MARVAKRSSASIVFEEVTVIGGWASVGGEVNHEGSDSVTIPPFTAGPTRDGAWRWPTPTGVTSLGCLETTWSPDVGYYSDPFVAVTVENPREVPPRRTQSRLSPSSTISYHKTPSPSLGR